MDPEIKTGGTPMEKNSIIDEIIRREWDMFHTVNGDDRTDCQDNYPTFAAMRRAQYEVWDEETRARFLEDITRAGDEGRNLSREKYIRMMKSTDPAGYAEFAGELPQVTPEQQALVADIWARILAQTERMREKFPILALGGRPLHASEERDGWASVETYQTSELLTYSAPTLRALLAHIEAMEAEGRDFAFEVQKNSVLCQGFHSMEEAEQVMTAQLLRQMGGTLDGSCGYGGNACGC